MMFQSRVGEDVSSSEPFPFGYTSNSNTSNLPFSVTFPVSTYNPQLILYFTSPAVWYSDLIDNINPPPINDTDPPIILNMTIVPISQFKYLIIVEIIDDLSGFQYLALEYHNPTKHVVITSSDLVHGNNKHGIYEKIVNNHENILTEFKWFLIKDNAGNTRDLPGWDDYPFFFNNRLQNVNMYSPTITITVNDITMFYFNYTHMDVSLSTLENELYFNTTKNDVNWKPEFTFGHIEENRLYTAFGYYDHVRQHYIVPFTVPARTFTTTLQYYIVAQPRRIDYSQLALDFPSNTTVEVVSSYGDELPPMITFIETYSGNVVDVDVDETVTIGWRFMIEDRPNGFARGSFNVTSDVDYLVRHFDISFINATYGTRYFGHYQILFNVTGAYRNQTFSFKDIILEDILGNKHNYSSLEDNREFNLVSSTLTPLSRVMNSTELSIKIQTKSTDVNGPVLQNLDIRTKSVDVGSQDRRVHLEFIVSDDKGYSINHLPTVYFTSDVFQITSLPTSIINQTGNTISFACDGQLPYGFGVGNGMVLVSIYGLMDTSQNLNGYSSTELAALGLESEIKITLTQTVPWIEDTLRSHGSVTVFGKNFGYNSTTEAVITLSTGEIRVSPTFQSGTMLIFNSLEIKPTNNFTIGIDKTPGGLSNVVPIIYIPPGNDKRDVFVPCPGAGTSSTCSGNGICMPTLGCQCDPGWYGPDCGSNVIPIVPLVDPSQPSATYTINDGGLNISAMISIVKLIEYDQSGLVSIMQYDLNNWTLTNSVGNVSNEYETIVKNGASIKVTTQWYFSNSTMPTTVYFAGDPNQVQQYTLKVSIMITDYPFRSRLNSLQLVMNASIDAVSDGQSCSLKQLVMDQSNSSVAWMRLRINNVNLYGQFIQKVIVDYRNAIARTVPLDSNSQATDGHSASTLIGINMPYFDMFAAIDPNFQVLIDSDGDKNNKMDYDKCTNQSSSSGLSKMALIGIIIGCIVVAAAIATGVAMMLRKNYHEKMDNKRVQHRLRELQK
ncbi:hypothetical protein SAMD00019534_052360 [Acytostelium subglobosum LB1]|uniref:hypothetical protein n=1 Tax=Acytostelium subglobosum LB1 TaxID=1410327 RepID=UPI00064514EE|nr:hypothetical protein SAMD00019534_052360 [Acytostelium subglobosum LB1]GAM22061.1 hypothetical protein SAMD00019534_052360 [Acytostelium subglobosum LB1]|eukprot:XP_012755161.1 hypothetical protein SAMD00019534_052360 [Acytostelium subglobosum LB1]